MPTKSVWPKLVGPALLIGLPLVAGIAVTTAKARLKQEAVAQALTGGNPALAPPIFRRYGCGGCHTIAGIPGADGKVGGPLAGLSEQVYIGGVVNNNSDNLVVWIVSPQRFSANSAMPATGVKESEARHLAAYLYAH
ncbi:c-type cytochrome [Neorhizobium sp. DAR64872/K0K18]|uniref:c-type cytochrome n=1 Tax=Neorhizobium sp. DAR64872/K0K18 TaxID=3421958 RepID=UPI003D290B32